MSGEKKGLFSGKSERNPKVSSGLRAVAGVYLVYLAYQIFDGLRKGEAASPFLWIAVIVFGGCGAVFALWGIRDLLMSREVRDLSEFEDTEEDEEDEDEEVIISDASEVSKPQEEKPAKMSIAERAKLTDRIADDSEE